MLRDYLIFILSVLKQCPIDEICTLSANDVEKLIFGAAIASQTNLEIEKSLKVRAMTLNYEYTTYVRPKFLESGSPSGQWFIGREGKCFAGHTLRERIAKLMHKDFADDLWHSCDVFVHSLGTPPLGRRLLRQWQLGQKKRLLNATRADGCVIGRAAYPAQNSELLKSGIGQFHVSSEFIATMV